MKKHDEIYEVRLNPDMLCAGRLLSMIAMADAAHVETQAVYYRYLRNWCPTGRNAKPNVAKIVSTVESCKQFKGIPRSFANTRTTYALYYLNSRFPRFDVDGKVISYSKLDKSEVLTGVPKSMMNSAYLVPGAYVIEEDSITLPRLGKIPFECLALFPAVDNTRTMKIIVLRNTDPKYKQEYTFVLRCTPRMNLMDYRQSIIDSTVEIGDAQIHNSDIKDGVLINVPV